MSAGFLRQLRDRQVFKTLVLYGAIAWGFYEIAKEFLVQFGFPAYTPRLLLIFLTLGLPAAIFLAWYFDADRRGVREEQRLERADWYVVAASLALPVVGSLVAFPYVATSVATTAGISAARNSVAVLPFSNLTGDESFEYLADGVAEEIITMLSGLDSIGVSARSLSFIYRDEAVEVSRAGQELNVAYIVRGSIQTSGNELRLRALLIDTASGDSLWSQTTDISVDDVFKGQDSISQGVAAALAAEIGFELPAVADKTREPDPAAYKLYLHGRHVWHQRGNLPLAPAVQSFAEAIRIDPEFARGWAALASAYLTWPAYSREGYATWQLAEDAAKRAIDLDPDLAEPYAVLSTFAERRNEWIEADRLFREAISRDDNSATSHYWYGEHLSKTGRYADSVRHMQRAIDLDPTYLPPQADFAYSVLHFRDYEGAAARFQAVWDKGLRSLTSWQGNFVSSMALGDSELAHGWVDVGPLPEPAKAMLQPTCCRRT